MAKEGQRIRARNSLPSPIQCGWETMGHTLTDGTHTDRQNDAWSDRTQPSKTGCGLGMAHHYRTPGAKTEASPHAGGSPPPQAGLRKTQTMGYSPGETIGLPKCRIL